MAQEIQLNEQYGLRRTRQGIKPAYRGEVEIIVRDRAGREIPQLTQKNIIKIGMKEVLAHRLPYSQIWDPNGGTGSGSWVPSGIDPTEEFAAKYILFGASFDSNGQPLDTADTRYYTLDSVTNSYIPITLGAGADYSGGLINAIPLADPGRPLKKIESIYFEPSYQPAGSPLLQPDVRAMNNTVVMETTLQLDEYNGFGLTNSDYFTITEVALAAGFQLSSVGSCECDPKSLFLAGDNTGTAILASTTATETVTIDPSESAFVDVIKVGDQVLIADVGNTAQDTNVPAQVTPYYLVVSKTVGGSDVVLDRTPSDASGNPIPSGTKVGLFRDTLRLVAHRVLSTPIKKSSDFSVTVRWRLIYN